MSEVYTLLNRLNTPSFKLRILIILSLIVITVVLFVWSQNLNQSVLRDDVVNISQTSSKGPITTPLKYSAVTDQSSSQSNGGSNGSLTKIVINGQQVPVPVNGTVTKTENNANGNLSYVINNQTSGSNNSSSKVSVQINSQSSSSSDTANE